MLDVARHHPVLTAVATALPESTCADGQRIRFLAADLFRQGRLTQALDLTEDALHQHPDSEDVLIIRALICEAVQDWPGAALALDRLIALQGVRAPVASWCHWVRVLRCSGQPHLAIGAALKALEHHPGDPALSSELAQLEAMGNGTTRLAA